MLTIISAICLAVFGAYIYDTIGREFYGNLADVIFTAIAIPLLFLQSRMKISAYIRRAKSKYFRVGRILSVVVAYLFLVMCATYIPIELRSLSTTKIIRPAIESIPKIKPIRRIIIFSYSEPDTRVLVISGSRAREIKRYVHLEKRKQVWRVVSSEKLNSKYYTFPPF